MRLADESRVSALKDQLNLPEKLAADSDKPTIVGSNSSSKQSENVVPIVGRSIVPSEAAAGVPLFTFSKTSFSAL